MKKVAIWKPAAGFPKKHRHFVIRQRAPRREGDLKMPETHLPRPLDPLQDGCQRETDQAHHGPDPRLAGFLTECPRDLIKLRLADGITFPRSSEKIQVLGKL